MNGYSNGTNGAAAGVGAPTAVPTVITQPGNVTRNGSTELVAAEPRDLDRFMPLLNIEQAIQRREFIVAATQRLMVEGVDYGKIPGAGDRPALLQPGADKLCNLFGIVIQYEVTKQEEDWSGANHNGEPFFYFQVTGRAYRGNFLMGEGVGSCSSWESKYRWRKMERTCPQCGKENIRKSKDGGWYCWRKTDGCGATFPTGDAAIEGQPVGRKPNPDPADVVNTVLKIAYKRTKVSTTINATSASEFFTQDVEDFTPPEEVPVDTGGAPVGTPAAAAYVAQQKIQTGKTGSTAPWRTMKEMSEMFKAIREKVGETAFYAELERWSWNSFQDIRNAIDNKRPNAKDMAIECYSHLASTVRKEVA